MMVGGHAWKRRPDLERRPRLLLLRRHHLLYLLSFQAFLSIADAFAPSAFRRFHPDRHRWKFLFGTNVLQRAASQSPNDHQTSNNEHHDVEYRPISDFVGGVHGGKYEFDPRLSGITSLNYEKSVVFGDVTSEVARNSRVAPAPDKEKPKWAFRPIDSQAHCIGDIKLENGFASVVLTNEELSWEPFYAMLESSSATRVLAASVEPSCGNLAPRGGSNQYADQCTLAVQVTEPVSTTLGDLYLVARTECDVWVWRLRS